MRFCPPQCANFPWFRCIGPCLVFGLIVYCTWGFAHKLCYDQINRNFHQRGTAIGLICCVSFLDLLLILVWYQAAIAVGPGRLPKVPPYMLVPEPVSSSSSSDSSAIVHSLVPPICYQCCPRGNPIWCMACESVKTERAHHSSDLNYCVPRFDHRCAWLGAVIGRDNYRFFIQFVTYMVVLSMFIFVPIFAFIKKIIDEGSSRRLLNPNLIAILIIAVLAWLMTTSMLVTHAFCIMTNSTSVELMAKKDKSHFNRTVCYYSSETKSRYVVEIKNNELRSLWRKKGVWHNVVDFLGPNVLLWFLPFNYNSKRDSHDSDHAICPSCPLQSILGSYYESFSEPTIDLVEKKIAANDYLTTFHAYGDKYL